MRTRSYLLLLATPFLLAACRPSVPAKLWENQIKPEMKAHKAWVVAMETFSDYNVKKHADYFDDNPRRHMSEAFQYIVSYVSDSLQSYLDVADLYKILADKNAAGDLHVENQDDAEDQMGGALVNALFGGSVYRNYTKEYILSVAEYLQAQYEKVDIELDSPEFKKKSKDRNIYSVYCPTLNEYYTLSIDRNTNNFYWDLTSRRNP